LKNELRDKQLDKLYDAFLTLETKEDCKNFLYDLCTSAELTAMAQRLEVAIMLQNKTVYSDIAAETGASSATICRVNQYLNSGASGYLKVLSKLPKALEE